MDDLRDRIREPGMPRDEPGVPRYNTAMPNEPMRPRYEPGPPSYDTGAVRYESGAPRYEAGAVRYELGAPRYEAGLARHDHPAAGHEGLATSSTYEIEVGRLFVRAQEFIDNTALEAREQANEIVRRAQMEAARIVDSAHQQARDIVREASCVPGVATDTLRQLDWTLDSFLRSNSELSREIAGLRANLQAASVRQPATGSPYLAPSSYPPEPEPYALSASRLHSPPPPQSPNGHFRVAN